MPPKKKTTPARPVKIVGAPPQSQYGWAIVTRDAMGEGNLQLTGSYTEDQHEDAARYIKAIVRGLREEYGDDTVEIAVHKQLREEEL